MQLSELKIDHSARVISTHRYSSRNNHLPDSTALRVVIVTTGDSVVAAEDDATINLLSLAWLELRYSMQWVNDRNAE